MHLWGDLVGISLRFGVLASLNGVGDRADDGRDCFIAHRKIADKGLARVLQQIYSILDVVRVDPQEARRNL